ncbi:MAG: hypothetical protein ABRQ24_10360 [Syntrophomonadaceae bacterium]
MMSATAGFELKFLRQEQHLMLPTITSIKLTQNLYDALFQYILTEDQEIRLKRFIDMLEEHIKRKDQAPFSVPIEDLEFLDEGLNELRLLNWSEIPVAVFELVLTNSVDADQEESIESITDLLERLTIFTRPPGSNLIWVYPYTMVR